VGRLSVASGSARLKRAAPVAVGTIASGAAGSVTAMGLSDFERRLERGVEGFFGRVFRSGVRPVELGRKLVREMDVHRSVDVSGAVIAPNVFAFLLAPEDHAELVDMEGALRVELVELARTHAADEGYRLPGPVEIELVVEPAQRAGLLQVEARFRSPGRQGGSLALPGGEMVPLDDEPLAIGRSGDADVVLADPNASRRHAEIRATAEGFEVVDLGSTNGTRVNGRAIGAHRLVDGDLITIGNTVLRFQQA